MCNGFCYSLLYGYFEQIPDDMISASRSLTLHSKDLVIAETKTGCLAMFTLDFDNNETSTDQQHIAQVPLRTNDL